MKVLVHDYSGHPFQIQLSRELAKRNDSILHIYSDSFQTPKGNLKKEDIDSINLNVKSIKLPYEFKKYSFLKRHFQELEYGKLLINEVDKFKPDIVISSNTPLDVQKLLIKYCNINSIPFTFWVQDLQGIAIKKILSKKYPLIGTLIGMYYNFLERRLFKKSDDIILISEDFKSFVVPYVEKNNIYVIENWAPIDEIPVKEKNNEWSVKNNLDKTKNIVYSGTLGMKHNPKLLFDLAYKLRESKDVKIIVISEGLGANWLKSKKELHKLDNLILMDYQPFEQMPNVLATADILVGILEEDAGTFSVPSKVLTYLCSGKPILLSVPEKNLSARIVKNTNAGIIVNPNNNKGFIDDAIKLLNDDELRNNLGKNARKYAEDTFNIKLIADKFCEIINKYRM